MSATPVIFTDYFKIFNIETSQ
uniref:Uncharacterized protein n=1 Tax=Arundo donax TaxID=35708 RepID=A0A0A8ZTM1_ARUDO